MSTEAERLALHTADLDANGHDTVAAGGGAPLTEITTIPTAELDTTKRLAPDGTGGVDWAAGGGGGGVTDHGALTGLADDDHPQYATDANLTTHAATSHGVTAHSALSGLSADDHPQYATDTDLTTHAATPHGGGGVTDHGLLTGLGDDDHPQYATDTDLTTHAATPHGATTLDGLTDVDTSTIVPTNGQMLVYESASSLWKPGSGATGFIGAKAYNSATQVLGAAGVLALDTEEFDSDGFHSTVTNTSRMTIPAGMGGKYLIAGHSSRSTSSTTDFWLLKNGVALLGSHFLALVTFTPVVVADLVPGDYIELYSNNAGTFGNTSANPHAQTSLSIVKLDSGKAGTGIGARATQSVATSLTHNAYTTLLFNTEEFDTDGFHSTVTNTGRLTIPAGLGGKYLIVGVAGFAIATGGSRFARITKNVGQATIGMQGLDQASGPTYASRLTVVAIVDLVPGDYVELLAFQSSGGAINSSITAGETTFSIARLDSGSKKPEILDITVVGLPGNVVSSGADSSYDDLNAGLVVTFEAPVSGAVLVYLSGGFQCASGFNFYWAMRRVSDSVLMGENVLQSGGAGLFFATLPVYVTGLTPGSIQSWKWSQRTNGGGTLTTLSVSVASMMVVSVPV